MKIRLIFIFSFIICLALISSGCILYRGVRMAGMEPNVRPLQDRPYEILGEEETKFSCYNLFWVWTVTENPDFNKAVLELINKKGGDDLIEVRWWRENQQWLVGTVTIIHIKGKVIRYIDE